MKPFIVLLTVFCISIVVLKFTLQKFEFARSAQIAMCAMLCFTAIGHFAFTKGMSMMVPAIIPFKTEVIYLTGILEILLAISLLIPSFRIYAGWTLIMFFIFMLPANVKASIDKLDYQKGTFDGNGPIYLWFRVPLQLLFIAWTYFSTLKH